MRHGRHIIYDTWQGKWLEIATMPTGDPRIIVTRWTRHRDRAYLFPSLQAARNMVEALGDGGQFEIHKSVRPVGRTESASAGAQRQDAGETRDRAKRQARGDKRKGENHT